MSSELRLYDVTMGTHKTRMRLDDTDAARLGDAAALVEERPATPPAAARPAPSDPVGKSRLVTSNKMRGTAEPEEPTSGRR